jgi:hypothetical protein
MAARCSAGDRAGWAALCRASGVLVSTLGSEGNSCRGAATATGTGTGTGRGTVLGTVTGTGNRSCARNWPGLAHHFLFVLLVRFAGYFAATRARAAILKLLGVLPADVHRLAPLVPPGENQRAAELAADLIIGRQTLRRLSRQDAPLGTVRAIALRQGVIAAALKQTEWTGFLILGATRTRGHRSSSLFLHSLREPCSAIPRTPCYWSKGQFWCREPHLSRLPIEARSLGTSLDGIIAVMR